MRRRHNAAESASYNCDRRPMFLRDHGGMGRPQRETTATGERRRIDVERHQHFALVRPVSDAVNACILKRSDFACAQNFLEMEIDKSIGCDLKAAFDGGPLNNSQDASRIAVVVGNAGLTLSPCHDEQFIVFPAHDKAAIVICLLELHERRDVRRRQRDVYRLDEIDGRWSRTEAIEPSNNPIERMARIFHLMGLPNELRRSQALE